MVDTPLQSANNIVSQSKRAVTTALVVSFGGIGGEESPSSCSGMVARGPARD